MTTFGDLYKPVKDFFGKVYVSDNRIDLTGKAEGGKFTTFLEQSGDKAKGEFAVENSLQMSSDLKSKYKFTLNTSGRAICKLTVTPKSPSGLEVNGQADMAVDASGDKFELSADYKNDPITATAALKSDQKSTVVDSSASVAVSALKGFTVGGNLTYNPQTAIEKFSYGAQYKAGTSNFAFVVEDQKKIKAGCTIATKSNGTPVTVGAEVVNNLAGAPIESFTAGVETKLNGQTMKAKLNQKGALSLALQTTLATGFKATYGMGTNILIPNGVNAAVKLEYEG